MPETFWGRIVMLIEEYSTSFLRGAGVTMIIALLDRKINIPEYHIFSEGLAQMTDF